GRLWSYNAGSIQNRPILHSAKGAAGAPSGSVYLLDSDAAGSGYKFDGSSETFVGDRVSAIACGAEGSLFALDQTPDAFGNKGVLRYHLGVFAHFNSCGRGTSVAVDTAGNPIVVAADGTTSRCNADGSGVAEIAGQDGIVVSVSAD